MDSNSAELQPAIRVLAAIANFAVATAVIVYLRIWSRDMRWSRSTKRFVTRNDMPAVYWSKMIFGLLVAFFTIALGVLLLVVKSTPPHLSESHPTSGPTANKPLH